MPYHNNGRWYILPWLAGLTVAIIFIVVAAIVLIVLSGVTVHWLSDSHFHVCDTCDDGDQCTKCLELEGGCLCLPRPEGHECHSACYYDESIESPYDTHQCKIERGDRISMVYADTGHQYTGEVLETRGSFYRTTNSGAIVMKNVHLVSDRVSGGDVDTILGNARGAMTKRLKAALKS